MGNTMFSTRHYTAIEEILRESRGTAGVPEWGAWAEIREALADLFEADNPKFKREKFYAECER